MIDLKLSIKASVVLAAGWLREFVLLFYSLVQLTTLCAKECSDLQLRLDLSGPSDRSLHRHDATQAVRLQVSDLVHSWKIVDANREPFALSYLMALIRKEHRETLAQVRLKAHIFTCKAIHELRVLPYEGAHVSKVDV